MSLKNTESRYGLVSMGLHWLMLVLLIAVYACIELRELYPKGSDPREALKTWHFMLGLGVFTLVWIRLAAFLAQVTPAISPAAPVWQMRLSKVLHAALYLLMIGMPIGGWLILSAEGDPIPYFGLELPPLIGPDEDLAHTIEEIHETGGKVGYVLIGIHALAALFHHYIMKDNTLRRMLPVGRAAKS
ncbi:MAG: cytochrome b [Proteobacteria bacterium]|jgi:superoxide oxidase|nr:cytochrome b [Pseudomonadota bacterium]